MYKSTFNWFFLLEIHGLTRGCQLAEDELLSLDLQLFDIYTDATSSFASDRPHNHKTPFLRKKQKRHNFSHRETLSMMNQG